MILEGPRGQRASASEDGSPVTSGGFVILQDPESSSTHVAIRRPAGSWRVSVAEGSPAIAGVDSADVLERPSVKARIGGRGTRRTLSWSADGARGQRITLTEVGRDSSRVIAKSSARRGRVRFTPAPGASRARRIVALVEQSGIPRASVTVARYRAPAWKRPARPKRLRVRRSGSALVATWARTPGAARYLVYATAADGERETFILPARKRRLRIGGVARDDRAVVRVSGLRADNVAGKAATARVKPVKPRRRRGR